MIAVEQPVRPRSKSRSDPTPLFGKHLGSRLASETASCGIDRPEMAVIL